MQRLVKLNKAYLYRAYFTQSRITQLTLFSGVREWMHCTSGYSCRSGNKEQQHHLLEGKCSYKQVTSVNCMSLWTLSIAV